MKRTWKDAACEMAWRDNEKYNDGTYFFFNASTFMIGCRGNLNYEKYDNPNNILIGKDFDAFRAAFMRWLDENEVRK